MTATAARQLNRYTGMALELTLETTLTLVDLVQRAPLDVACALLLSAAGGARNQALPTMEMVFAGHPDLHQKEIYRRSESAEREF